MHKGRALIAPCLIVTIWVMVRAGAYVETEPELSEFTIAEVAQTSVNQTMVKDSILASYTKKKTALLYGRRFRSHSIPDRKVRVLTNPKRELALAQTTWQHVPKLPANTPPGKQPDQKYGDAEDAETSAPDSKSNARKKQPQHPKRLAVYAYAFWRDADNASLAPAAQYGASQAGLIATYRLGQKETAPALLVRTSSELDGLQNPELAVGLRWRPIRNVPVELTTERRFRRGASDAFAAYLAGGYEFGDLPFDLRVLSYGQAGIVLADRAARRLDYFYDGNARIERKVASRGQAKLSVGAGVWAGGQRDVNRVDAGPTAAIDFGFAQTNFRLSADYRFRVAGNADPPSGPAVTLSASY